MDSRHQARSDCWKKTCRSDLSVQRGTKATIDNCFPCSKAKLSVCLNWLHCFLLYNCTHKRVTWDTLKRHLNQIPVLLLVIRAVLRLPVLLDRTETRQLAIFSVFTDAMSAILGRGYVICCDDLVRQELFIGIHYGCIGKHSAITHIKTNQKANGTGDVSQSFLVPLGS